MERTFYLVAKGYDRSKGDYVYKVSLTHEMNRQVVLEWATLDSDMSDITSFPIPAQFIYDDGYGLQFDAKAYNAYLLLEM